MIDAKYKVKVGIVSLITFLIYFQFIIGMLSAKLTGVTLIPLFSLILGSILYFNKKVFSQRLILLVLLLLFFFTISYFISSKGEYSTYKYIFLCLKVTIYLFLGFLVSRAPYTYSSVASKLLLIFVLYTLLYCIFNSASFDVNNRVFIGIFNPIWIGRIIFEFLILTIFFQNWKKSVNIIFLIVCLYITYMTGSKGAVFSFIVTFIYALYTEKKVSSFSLIVCIMLFICLFFTLYLTISEESYFFQRFMSAVPAGTSEGLYNESRIVVWPNTVSLILSSDIKALLFGNGLGEFGKFYTGIENYSRFYPHNFILECIVELGFLFLIIFGGYVLQQFNKSDSKFKLLFVYYFVNSLFSGDFLLNEFLYFYLGCILGSNISNDPAYKIT
jgi:hypothetical protein